MFYVLFGIFLLFFYSWSICLACWFRVLKFNSLVYIVHVEKQLNCHVLLVKCGWKRTFWDFWEGHAESCLWKFASNEHLFMKGLWAVPESFFILNICEENNLNQWTFLTDEPLLPLQVGRSFKKKHFPERYFQIGNFQQHPFYLNCNWTVKTTEAKALAFPKTKCTLQTSRIFLPKH